MKNSEEFLNFCSKFLINFEKFYQKVFDKYSFAECHFKPKFCRHCSTGLEWNSCMKFCLLSPPHQNKIWRRPDFHPVIRISHDEVIDIFAFSSVRRLNFTLLYSAYFVVFYILKHFKTIQVPPRQNFGAATDKYKFKIVLVKKR